MFNFKLSTPVLALVVAAALSACGGGDGGGGGGVAAGGSGQGSASDGIPASATQNVAGLMAFMNQLVAASSETSDPILLGEAVLPTDDTADVTS